MAYGITHLHPNGSIIERDVAHDDDEMCDTVYDHLEQHGPADGSVAVIALIPDGGTIALTNGSTIEVAPL